MAIFSLLIGIILLYFYCDLNDIYNFNKIMIMKNINIHTIIIEIITNNIIIIVIIF